MPFCPECKSEYIDGITVCSDCGSQLVAYLEEEIHFSSDSFSCVFKSDSIIEIEMLKTNLESAGIHAYILNTTDRSYPSSNIRGQIMVFVQKADYPDAEEFLKSLALTQNILPENEGDAND